MTNEFEINYINFFAFLDRILTATKNQEKIFQTPIEHFLPEWNLPPELEYSPQIKQTKNPKKTALFLFTRASIDRMSVSKSLQKRVLETWKNPEKRWIFYPKQVARKSIKSIEDALKQDFKYALPINPSLSAGQGYKKNAITLIEFYNADPRNIIKGKTIKEAATDLQEFEGIKEIAYMIIKEYHSRDLISPIDPENLMFKIDIHKSRLPLQCGSINLKNGQRRVHHTALINPFKQTYLQFCQERNLSSEEAMELDNALWVIGSEICVKKSYAHCDAFCPLQENHCRQMIQYNTGKKKNDPTNPKGYVRDHFGRGSFIIHNQDGSLTEIRGQQQDLFFKANKN